MVTLPWLVRGFVLLCFRDSLVNRFNFNFLQSISLFAFSFNSLHSLGLTDAFSANQHAEIFCIHINDLVLYLIWHFMYITATVISCVNRLIKRRDKQKYYNSCNRSIKILTSTSIIFLRIQSLLLKVYIFFYWKIQAALLLEGHCCSRLISLGSYLIRLVNLFLRIKWNKYHLIFNFMFILGGRSLS